MQPSMQLFHLIKSLDATEVRYVRSYAKRKDSDGSACLRLFDLIHRCTTYEEKKFADEIAVANFPALKIYTRDLIADAILEKNLKKKGVAEVMALIGQIELFYKKGFMQLMWARLEKGLQLCERYEAFGLWRDLLARKHSLLMIDAPVGHTPKGLDDFDERYSEVKLKGKNIEEFRELEDLVTFAPRRGSIAMYEMGRELLNHPLLADDAPRLSHRAEIKFHQLRRIVFRWGNQHARSLMESEKILSILDLCPQLMVDEEHYLIYVGRLYHIGWFAAASGNMELANSTIKRLAELNAYPIYTFERIHSIELRLAMEECDLAKAEATVEQIAAGMKTLEYKMSNDRKIAYCYQIAHLYLYFNQSAKALKWILLLRECEPSAFKNDVRHFGEILYLICHFELENFDFLRSETKKVANYLEKHLALTDFESAIATGLRKAAIAPTPSKRMKRLHEMNDKLFQLLEEPKFAVKGNYFQFALWISSKEKGIRIVDGLQTYSDRLTKYHQG